MLHASPLSITPATHDMIIRLHDCPSQPWKNGLGRTRELALHPPGATNDDFLWRVSIAEVDSAAPFSTFPGIDRQIALLDGDGFTMTLDGTRVHALTQPFAPFAFAGEAQVAVTLLDGPTRDFNLMVRRAHARGSLHKWTGAGPRTVPGNAVLIFCASGPLDTVNGCLQPGDAWRPDNESAQSVTLHEDTTALVVCIKLLDR